MRIRAETASDALRTSGRIEAGLLLLVGITHTDTSAEVAWMAEKIPTLRVFADDDGRMNRSLVDVHGAVLVVSQFTLYGDARRGRRPSFVNAALPNIAEALYTQLIGALRGKGVRVEAGEFGAMMEVELVNDGPVTIWLEREADEGVPFHAPTDEDRTAAG